MKCRLEGAIISGRATFSDGNTAMWFMDQTGRFGMRGPDPWLPSRPPLTSPPSSAELDNDPSASAASKLGTKNLEQSPSMLLIIDNYDSFTYNLVQYFGEMGAVMEIRRNDQITLDEIEKLKP
jgi:hypothetical protein